jgi:uncharacterized membrane protein
MGQTAMAQFLQVPAKDKIVLVAVTYPEPGIKVYLKQQKLICSKTIQRVSKNCDKLIAYTSVLAAGSYFLFH